MRLVLSLAFGAAVGCLLGYVFAAVLRTPFWISALSITVLCYAVLWILDWRENWY